MATLYGRGGKRDKLAWIVSRHVDVQGKLDLVADERAAAADAILRTHRQSGDSRIEVTEGDVDRFVNLIDEPTDGSEPRAMSIEMGAANGRGGVHALAGAFPEAPVIRGR